MAKTEKLEISSNAVKKTLKGFSPEDAVCQYIWNGFDAGATEVQVKYTVQENSLGLLAMFSIHDNGWGINFDELSKKFKPFYESEKAQSKRSRDSTMRGQDGYGRLTFFTFCQSAHWDTVYSNGESKFSYGIDINSDTLDKFSKSDPVACSLPVGTIVRFSSFLDKFHPDFIEKKLLPYILNEFAWYLEVHKDVERRILINGIPVEYSSIISDTDVFPLKITQKEGLRFTFNCYFIQWASKLNDELSRFYLLNEKYELKKIRTTKLNKKGDKFYHSMVVRSDFFNSFITPDEDDEPESEDNTRLKLFGERDEYTVFNELIEQLNKYLRKRRKPFLKKYSNVVVAQLEKDNAFPRFGNNTWDKLKKEELITLVKELYEVEPALFISLNIEQKKTFLHLLNLIIDNDQRETLFKILDDVVRMDVEDREELRQILTTTRLSSIVKATRLVQDRILASHQIKNLVFNHDLKANEKDHLQQVVEQHFWLFGEQYTLVCAAEVKFEEALRRHRYILTGENKKRKIDHPDKQKEMDVFLVRQDYQIDRINNVVLELKNPTTIKRLTQKEFNQVQTYMSTILKVDEFNAANYHWEFFLIGQDYDDFIFNQLENSKHHGEFGLAFQVKNYKIYVKKWSEVFNEVDLRLKWINDKLQVEKAKLTAGNDPKLLDDLLTEIAESYAAAPHPVLVAKA